MTPNKRQTSKKGGQESDLNISTEEQRAVVTVQEGVNREAVRGVATYGSQESRTGSPDANMRRATRTK